MGHDGDPGQPGDPGESLSRRRPGTATGHRPASYSGPPRLPPELLQRMRAAVDAAAASPAEDAGDSPAGPSAGPPAPAPAAAAAGLAARPEPITEPIPAVPGPDRPEAASGTGAPPVSRPPAPGPAAAPPDPPPAAADEDAAAAEQADQPPSRGTAREPRRPSAPARPARPAGPAGSAGTSGPVGSAARRRHRRLAAVASASTVAVLLGAGSLAHALINAQPRAARPSVGQTWQQAGTWIARQLSRNVSVTCDALMCAVLRYDGFPGQDLRQWRPGPAPVLRTAVVVATPDVRRTFGARLGTTVAPGMIASFGTGQAQIQVRVAAPAAGTFRSLLATDLAARRQFGPPLITSGDDVTAGPQSTAELAAGQVDSRLLTAIETLGYSQSIRILSFGDASPGASLAVSPLRSVVLAQPPAASGSNKAYIRSMLGFFQAQRSEFRASSTQLVRLRGGREALRITYPAPSQLGLLDAQPPAIRTFG